jgi:hypothetical protein
MPVVERGTVAADPARTFQPGSSERRQSHRGVIAVIVAGDDDISG